MSHAHEQNHWNFIVLGAAILISAFCVQIAVAQSVNPGTNPEKPISWKGELPLSPNITFRNNNLQALVEASSPIDWHHLVYQAYVNDNWEIYASASNGANPVNLTNNSSADASPRLNRGATRVVFDTYRDGNWEIYAVDIDGSDLLRLTFDLGDDFSPAWSYDGGRIAFVSSRDNNDEIYVMNADGSNPTRLTNNLGDDEQPQWSPDGSQIAWLSCTSACSIWIMDANGGNAHAITGEIRYLQHPVWSPDGKQIAFDGDLDDDYWNELGIINLTDYTIQTVLQPYALNDLWMGAWSSDGQTLLFSWIYYQIIDNSLYLQAASVYHVPSAGGSPTSINTASYMSLNADWQNVDLLSPTSSITPLPFFSRAFSFPVSWTGIDFGPSGINLYEVEYQHDVSEPWQAWLTTPQTAAFYSGNPGENIHFRVRAKDNAGNLESWGAGITNFSQLFTWELSGTLNDNRGFPLYSSMINLNPTPLNNPRTDPNGQYQVFLETEGAHSLSIARPGFDSLAVPSIPINSDLDRVDYLPPIANLISNGGFEEDSTAPIGWEAGGDLPIALKTTSHTGTQAASMGANCPDTPCLRQLNPAPDTDGRGVSMVVDQDETIHAIFGSHHYSGTTHDSGLYYSFLKAPMGWSDPVKIFSNSQMPDTNSDIAIGPDGTLHLIWDHCEGCSHYYLHYTQKLADGTWMQNEDAGEGGKPHIVVDQKGVLHMVYQDLYGNTTNYRQRLPNGTWTEPIHLKDSIGTTNAIALGPDGTVHILFTKTDFGREVYYQSINPQGIWTQPLFLARQQSGFRNLRIVVEKTGRVHVLLLNLYATRDPKGNWSSPMTLPIAYKNGDISVDSQGLLHLAGSSPTGSFYQTRQPDGTWSSSFKLNSDPISATEDSSFALEVDHGDSPNILFCINVPISCYFYMTSSPFDEGMAAISQTISIPANMHRPTLAFIYSLRGTVPGLNSMLDVSVTDQLSTTQVFSATKATDWVQKWVDMEPWAGQTITVSFTLRQSNGLPYIHLLLDDVSLGPWLTPMVSSVTPNRIEVYASQTITITGNNFIHSPTLRLGNVSITNVEWVDEHTIRAVLPAKIKAGLLDLWVVNPGGQEGALQKAILLGKVISLPVIFH